MLKFKGNVSANQVVDSMIKGKSNPLKKRKFSELDNSQQAITETHSKTEEGEKVPEHIVKKYKTPSEISFDLVKKKRVFDRIERKLESSHKEKIEKFNKGLSKLSDHFDIPRVGPG